ncbi:hypothetical protein GJ496_002589 [Pomphorhynchus laevis]|nr:hypothetical protein GJ496_002589 [Pomphorhynchus laevis]
MASQFVSPTTKPPRTTDDDGSMLMRAAILCQSCLQKVGANKTSSNRRILSRRSALWESRNYHDLVQEGMCIQNNIDRLRHQRKNDYDWHNLCLRLFQSGKVSAVVKVIEDNYDANFLHSSTIIDGISVKQILELKHPPGAEIDESVILDRELYGSAEFHHSLFKQIVELLCGKSNTIILSLPLRFGGLGIANPCVNSVKEWQYSAIMCQALDSSEDSDSLATRLQTASEKIRRMRQLDLKEVFQAISEECDPDRKIAIKHATLSYLRYRIAKAHKDISHVSKEVRSIPNQVELKCRSRLNVSSLVSLVNLSDDSKSWSCATTILPNTGKREGRSCYAGANFTHRSQSLCSLPMINVIVNDKECKGLIDSKHNRSVIHTSLISHWYGRVIGYQRTKVINRDDRLDAILPNVDVIIGMDVIRHLRCVYISPNEIRFGVRCQETKCVPFWAGYQITSGMNDCNNVCMTGTHTDTDENTFPTHVINEDETSFDIAKQTLMNKDKWTITDQDFEIRFQNGEWEARWIWIDRAPQLTNSIPRYNSVNKRAGGRAKPKNKNNNCDDVTESFSKRFFFW